MTEEDEEPPAAPLSNGLDWERMYKLMEDPDIEDIFREPVDAALKNLTSDKGKDVQKIQVIRSLPNLLESHADETIESLLPAIQKVLREEKENLDIHCEAAVVFKSILQNDNLCNTIPGLSHVLLKHILGNIPPPVEIVSDNRVLLHMGPTPQIHHSSTAAWLETLVDIADRVSLDAQKQYIIPIVKQQAEPTQRVQRRIIATKLLHKLADIFSPSDIRKELASVAQVLSQDPNGNVRSAMAERLPVIARALKNPSDTVTLLVPSLVHLCNDDEGTVKEACFHNLASWFPHLTKESKKTTIFPLIKKTIEQCIDKMDDLLMTLTENIGEWVFLLMDILDQLDLSWVLNTYLKICKLFTKSKEEKTSAFTLMCRRMCAYNIPCFVELFPKAFDKILPMFEKFCHDSDVDVRMSIAASYHEIIERKPDRKELLEPFIELIRGGAIEVVAKITFHLDKMLPHLYRLAQQPHSKITHVQLDRILVGCNQLLRGTGSWRSHEALLNHISVLREVLQPDQLYETFIPFLQKEVLTVRAIPCRRAAVKTLLLFMRQNPDKEKREKVINFLKKEIAEHSCSYRRSLFVDVLQSVLEIFSRQFFFEYFLMDLLNMANDSDSNIRLRIMKLLSEVKIILLLPDDDTTLVDLEKAVRTTLSNEKKAYTRQLMQAAACELSRKDSLLKEDSANVIKVEKETELWSTEKRKEDNDTAVESRRPEKKLIDSDISSRLGVSEPARSVSPWKQKRRTVAIVRPQPVVVFRSASPVPKISDGGRPSRLPLSTANRDRDYTRKSSIDLITSRSSPRPPILRNTMSLSSEGTSVTSPTSSFGLRRSATTTSAFSSSSSSQQSYPLCSSRSSSCLRRPTFGLSRVSSHSTFERKPPQLSLRVKES